MNITNERNNVFTLVPARLSARPPSPNKGHGGVHTWCPGNVPGGTNVSIVYVSTRVENWVQSSVTRWRPCNQVLNLARAADCKTLALGFHLTEIFKGSVMVLRTQCEQLTIPGQNLDLGPGNKCKRGPTKLGTGCTWLPGYERQVSHEEKYE